MACMFLVLERACLLGVLVKERLETQVKDRVVTSWAEQSARHHGGGGGMHSRSHTNCAIRAGFEHNQISLYRRSLYIFQPF